MSLLTLCGKINFSIHCPIPLSLSAATRQTERAESQTRDVSSLSTREKRIFGLFKHKNFRAENDPFLAAWCVCVCVCEWVYRSFWFLLSLCVSDLLYPWVLGSLGKFYVV